MAITKVFQSGNSQAVRIPREFQFDLTKVEMSGTAMRLSYAIRRAICRPLSLH